MTSDIGAVVSDCLADLRAQAEAATSGPWGAADGGSFGGWWISRFGDPEFRTIAAVPEGFLRDAEHIATFDPPTCLAILSVVELAAEIASDDYLEQPGPYATGIHREEAIALTEAVARLRTLTGEDT